MGKRRDNKNIVGKPMFHQEKRKKHFFVFYSLIIYSSNNNARIANKYYTGFSSSFRSCSRLAVVMNEQDNLVQ